MGKNIDTVNPLVLAWVGDARLGAYVRTRLALETDCKVNALQRRANGFVSARAQAVIYERMASALTEGEQETARRARNAHPGHAAKHASAAEYQKATALEAVLGAAHLGGETGRERELLELIYEWGERLWKQEQ